jgi:hypothetical protein
MSIQSQRRPYLSLRYKILFQLMALGVVIFVFAYFGGRWYLRETIFNILNDEVQTIRDFLEDCINEDVLYSITYEGVEYDPSAGWPAGMTDPRYWEQQACLDDARRYNPRAEVYTYYAVNEDTLATGLDQWTILSPEDSYPLGDVISPDENDWQQYKLGLEDTYSYSDLKYIEEDEAFRMDEGYYYAVTSPLRDSRDEVIGGLVIYLDAGWAVENLQELSNYLVGIFAAVYLLITVLVLASTRKTMSHLTALKDASMRVAGGDYTPVTLKRNRFDDEVTTLAELFNAMLGKVREREETLQNEVEVLKIRIDMEKRTKDVKEVVETEFFQDLKKRAAAVRRQRSQKE